MTLLQRRLGLTDAVFIGLAAMVGAGIFVVFAPAAAAAGNWLLASLAGAAAVAYCNARSTAVLAARYPVSGGAYVYGREQLGPLWGFLAGWAFVVGKVGSCAAIATAVGYYLWPNNSRLVAVAAVIVVTAVNAAGVQRSARVGRWLVIGVLSVLAAVVWVSWAGPSWAGPSSAGQDNTLSITGMTLGQVEAHPVVGIGGVLTGAGLIFFAFAGYARIATLGEEVRDPARTIPRAIGIALAATAIVYLAVALALLHTLGPKALAAADRPLADTVVASGQSWLLPIVSVAAGVAALGSLMALVLGVSRTSVAMARNRDLPSALAGVSDSGVPRRAEFAVGAIVVVLAAFWDLRDAIGFSSLGVLVYYAIANASAWNLRRRWQSRVIPGLGFAGCIVLCATLPLPSVITGAAVLGVGVLGYLLRPTPR